MPRARVNGIETYYEMQGDGLPVLFIHGGYGGAATTVLPTPHPVTHFLADGVQLVTYDRRSRGLSEYVLDHYGLVDLAKDAMALLDHLGIERAVVIGSSAGGPVALRCALSYPDRVIALGLPNTGAALMCEAPPAGLDPTLPAVEARLALVHERLTLVRRANVEGDRALFEARKASLRNPPQPVGGGPAQAGVAERHARLLEALARLSEDELFTYSTGEIRNLESSMGIDFTDDLGRLAMPVFVVHGTKDAIVPLEYGEALAGRIPHAVFHVVEGAGHGILAYREAQTLVRDWVAGLAAEV